MGKDGKFLLIREKRITKTMKVFAFFLPHTLYLKKKKKKQLIAEQYCDGNMAQENNVMIIGPAGQTELNKKVLTNS